MCANWHDFHDPNSGISLYEWGVGSEPGVMDILGPISVSHTKHACCGRVTVQHNVAYYNVLVAYHGGSDMLNVTGSSNGGTL